MSDIQESERNTIAINVQATIVNDPPVFQQASYTFEISENANDTQEISSLSVTDDSGKPIVYSHTLCSGFIQKGDALGGIFTGCKQKVTTQI